MNPFQRARNEATRIRALLLQENFYNAVPARQILARVESELNIGISPVSASYPDLGGGTAVLHREQQYIYVSDAVTEWGSDFCGLVAHEVGHYFLDSALSSTKVSDLSAILESHGSPGTLVIEAYGARERQELQANVFSRELLLPRAVARKLANDGITCSDIANRLGIPKEFARLQLLDALLLPEFDEVESPLSAPSPDQYHAARASERAANVIAGPGTGKTTTLIHRVKYLIDEKKVDASKILVLTFTNKAALELVERLRSAGINNATDIWAGTFHAFGLEFTRKYHDQFGLDADLHVSDQLSAISMMAAALPRISLDYYLRIQDPYTWLIPVMTAISRLKEELITPEAYKKFVISNPSEDLELQLRRGDVAKLFELYQNLLLEKKSIDFVDLISKPALALRDNRANFFEIAQRYDYVLVDEYQDVTQAMVEMLRQVAFGKSIWVVGDVRQAVHHWRGASLKSLLKFDLEFKAHSGGQHIQRYPLGTNRRSSQEIVNLTQHVGQQHALQNRLPLDAVSSSNGFSGHKPSVVICSEKSEVSTAIAQSILSLNSQGLSFKKQAVLCRSSTDLQSLAETLTTAGIPCIYVGELGKRAEVKQMLCFMQLLVERSPKALVGLQDIDGLRISLKDISEILTLTERDISYQRGGWLKLPLDTVSSAGQEVVKHLRSLIGSYTANSNPWDLVCDLLLDRRIPLPKTNDNSVPAWVKRLSLWQFAYSVRNGDGDIKSARLSRYLMRQRLRQRIGETQGLRDLPPEAGILDGVRLLTVHASKGLEFDAVHVAHVKADTYGAAKPNWSPEGVLDLVPPEALNSSLAEYENEAAAERNNLLYVAVSRAKRFLGLYQDSQYGDLAPQIRTASTLVDEFDFNASRTKNIKPSTLPSFAPVSRLSFESFNKYVRCPLRYWYSDVLSLKSESDVDVSVKARMAIMESLKLHASGKLGDVSLEASWKARRLPSSLEDPELWRDANIAFSQGMARVAAIQSQGGVYQELTSSINGVILDMPWGFSVTDYQGTHHSMFRFSRHRVSDLLTVLRPLTPTLSLTGPRKLCVRYVLSDKVDVVPDIKRIAQTKSFSAAVRFLAGENRPTAGHHCDQCDFLSICPSTPH